jgi:hypothetical protein
MTSTRMSRAMATTILRDCLGGGRLAVGDPVQLGDAVDQAADLVTEVSSQCFEGVLGVLDRVVQQCRRQGRAGHAQLGQDRGHRQRVGDVGLAGTAQLLLVQQPSGLVGALQKPQIGLGVVLLDRPEQRLQFRIATASSDRDPGQSVPKSRDLLGGCLNRGHRVEARGGGLSGSTRRGVLAH